MLLFLIVVLAAVIFEYSNGFHDAANAIATVVSTKVLTPRQAIVMAAFFNLTGALLGGAVASTIGKGLVDTNVVTMPTVLAAVVAAFAWNMTTWWFGFSQDSDFHPSYLGHRYLRVDDGRWDGRGRLAHHSHARSSYGEIATGERFCCRDHRCSNYSSGQPLWDSSLNDARNNSVNYGRRRSETFQRRAMERGRADYLGMAFYATRERANWLHTGARGCSGAVIFALP